ncbi:TPA: WbqC family protein [Campylobacter coli]|nr:WbqC family protein [Campylobacter coli]HEB9320840.1 WbqC family protein [Campylobacter coli]
MTIAIMQPTFLPWIGYIYMIHKVDQFIFLDNVQFEQRSWQSRNKIKLQNKTHFLSLSCQKCSQKTLLSDIKLSKDLRWKNKLLETLRHAYSKSINYQRYFNLIKNCLEKNKKLTDLNIELITQICKDLNITTPLIRASNLNLPEAKRENLLFEICKLFKSNSYLSPEGSRNYLDHECSKNLFKQGGIKINYFDFNHPYYKQQGSDFIAYLSVIDFLFNTKNPALEFNKITGLVE